MNGNKFTTNQIYKKCINKELKKMKYLVKLDNWSNEPLIFKIKKI